MSKSVVLVTGGAGFIGSNLVRRLLSRGERVRVLDSLARRGAERNLTWLRELGGSDLEVRIGDVRNRSLIREAMVGVTHVFHLAAQVAVTTSLDDPIADFDVNAGGTLHVLEAVRTSPLAPTLIFTSTNKVYGSLADVSLEQHPQRYVPIDDAIRQHGISEKIPLEFHSPYGCSKGAADQYVLDYARTFGVSAVVLRMSCIYGPRQFGNEDQGWLAHFLIRTLQGQPITIYGDGRQVRDVLYVDDLLDALCAVRERAHTLAGRAFNVGGGSENSLSLSELLNIVRQGTGRSPRVEFQPWRLADQRYYISDYRLLQSMTGWAPQVATAEGIARLSAWIEELVGAERRLNGGSAVQVTS